MQTIALRLVLSAVLTLYAASASSAETAPPEAGRCLACHGIEGFKYGDVSVPYLRRQNPRFIVKAIKDFQSGAWQSEIMRPQVADLNDAQIKALAAFLGGPREEPPLRATGASPKLMTEECGTCHGPAGYGGMPEVPVLTGQYKDYLMHALRSYRDGTRKNLVMEHFAKAHSEEELEDVVSFLAQQKALTVPK